MLTRRYNVHKRFLVQPAVLDFDKSEWLHQMERGVFVCGISPLPTTRIVTKNQALFICNFYFFIQLVRYDKLSTALSLPLCSCLLFFLVLRPQRISAWLCVCGPQLGSGCSLVLLCARGLGFLWAPFPGAEAAACLDPRLTAKVWSTEVSPTMQ